jgi:hypothetical protein
MAEQSTTDRRGVASHWKMAGLLAGGLAVGYALVQERERVTGAVANVQDTLTGNGLTLMEKLSKMADAFLAKVHETLVAAAPPTNLEAAVRHGLIRQLDDEAAPHHQPAAPNQRETVLFRFKVPPVELFAKPKADPTGYAARPTNIEAAVRHGLTGQFDEATLSAVRHGLAGQFDDVAVLRHQLAAPNQLETVPFWVKMPQTELLAKLKADPTANSVVVYDRTVRQYDPFMRVADAGPTELFDCGDFGTAGGEDVQGAEMAMALRYVPAAESTTQVAAEVEPQPEQQESPVAQVQPVVQASTAAPASTQPSRKRKQRAAAIRAIATFDADPDYEEPEKHPVKVLKPPVPPAKELSLADALLGTGLSPIPLPLDLDDMLEGVLGRSIAYKWEPPWGWAAGRLAPPEEDESNFTVLYKDNCSEQQTLSVAAYGGEAYGAWVLLDGALAPPIHTFEKGKYLVAGAWKRAKELYFHLPNELKAARDVASAAKATASQLVEEEEVDTGNFNVGARVYARTLAPDGEHAWFICKLLSMRARYPPLQVEFLATLDGETSALQLPLPRKAFVSAVDVSLDEPRD